MLIDQVTVHFASTKNREYRQRVLDRFTVLLEVLNHHEWINHNVIERFKSNSETFELHSDDLTTEGFNFIRGHYDSWLRSLDKPLATDYAEEARKRLTQRAEKQKIQAEQAAPRNR